MSGSIFLETSEISVGETDGNILIPIVRTGDLSQATTITFGITDGTATSGADYSYTGPTSVIMPAQEDRITVSVDILDDGDSEPTETFVLSVIGVSSGTLLFPRTSRVDILDDENPVTDPPDPPLVSDYPVTEEIVVPNLVQPLAFEFYDPPGSSSLMYIAEKGGIIKVYDLDTGATTEFLDISDKVNNVQDRGLMDIALHPNFPTEPWIYAFYVVDPPEVAGNSGNAGPNGGGNRFAHVVRFKADQNTGFKTAELDQSGDPIEELLIGAAGQTLADISGNGAIDSTIDTSIPSSDVIQTGPDAGEYIQDYIKVDSRSHAGGALEFGPDGKLYVSIGDGTSFDLADPRSIGVQDLDSDNFATRSLSGKILRIDPDTGEGFTENPFYDGGSLDDNDAKIYQTGSRNPFRMAFDDNGRLFISETGWESWEEINSGEAGANFGWPFYEGGDNGVLNQTNTYKNFPEAAGFYAAVDNGDIEITQAFRAFSHSSNDPGFQVQAIVGADSIYTGSQYPVDFLNDYFFTDISQGEVYTVDTNDRRDVKYLYTTDDGFGPAHFKQGPDGYMYYADLISGNIGRLLISGQGGGVDLSFDLADFSSVSDIQLNGDASQALGSVLRLDTGTLVIRPGVRSIICPGRSIPKRRFQQSSDSRCPAVKVQAAPTVLRSRWRLIRGAPNALGDPGISMGYSDITPAPYNANRVANSIAVEFDTYQNGFDLDDNHIGILQGGDVTNHLARTGNLSGSGFDLNDGTFKVWIDYNVTGTDLLEVYLSDAPTNDPTKPATPILTHTVALDTIVGNEAWFGFTAGTGGLFNNHDILDWELSSSSSGGGGGGGGGGGDIQGTSGDDRLEGTAGNDSMYGLGGNDTW